MTPTRTTIFGSSKLTGMMSRSDDGAWSLGLVAVRRRCCRTGLSAGRLVEPGEEPGQGTQLRFPQWGQGSGVGDEVAPELVAQVFAFGGEGEGLDAAVGGVGLAFERSALGEPVDDGGEVGGVVAELPGELAHRDRLAGGEAEQDLDLGGGQAERVRVRGPVLA